MQNSNKTNTQDPSFAENTAFIFHSKVPIEELEPGIKRQILAYNDEMMAVRVWFEKGAIGQLHKHPHSQISYVESGEFEVTVGSNSKTLAAGDSVFIVPETMHGVVCKQAGVVIDMFSPMREDFLGKGE